MKINFLCEWVSYEIFNILIIWWNCGQEVDDCTALRDQISVLLAKDILRVLARDLGISFAFNYLLKHFVDCGYHADESVIKGWTYLCYFLITEDSVGK